jgi:acyl carrier protein
VGNSVILTTVPAQRVTTVLAEVLAEVVDTDHLSIDSHFFDELGADSMVMARFCARVRKRENVPPVSMRDVYRHPTIRDLATALVDSEPTPAPQPAAAPAPVETSAPTRGGQYVLIGALQLVFLIGYPSLTAYAFLRGVEWIAVGADLVDIYLRSVLVGSATAEVGARRPVEASGDPRLEHGVLPFLGRQDADPAQPDGVVRGFAAVCVLSQGVGREGRTRRRDLL